MTPADQALRALALLALDPGLGGLLLRARTGPVSAKLETVFHASAPLARRIAPTTAEAAVFGGMDVSATLAKGQIVRDPGLLATPAALTLPMAERLDPGMAARLGQAIEDRGHIALALDESAEPEDHVPPALAERLAFHIDLSGVRLQDLERATAVLSPPAPTDPRRVKMAAGFVTQIARLSVALGVESLRAPVMAMRAARAHAALWGRNRVESDDIELAVLLVLAHRATRLPEEAAPPPPQEGAPETAETKPGLSVPDEVVLEAVRATLPADLLARLHAKATVAGRGKGAGAKRRGNRRGRPLAARRGRLDRGRLDLLATLRAAAPWQKLRTRRGAVAIRPEDIHIRRYEDRSDRLLVFAVDASGSAAFARMAEAKGAVELLLAQAYARRDHVALVSFRGAEAEVLLPPTRSLVQTKKRLAALPGGGGTPLAKGMMAALELAQSARGRGMSPAVVLLTDGRPNIGLDGAPGRAQAAEDATRLARAIRASGIEALVIDCGNRPERTLRTLAQSMDATYLPLPRADARGLSNAVDAALMG